MITAPHLTKTLGTALLSGGLALAAAGLLAAPAQASRQPDNNHPSLFSRQGDNNHPNPFSRQADNNLVTDLGAILGGTLHDLGSILHSAI